MILGARCAGLRGCYETVPCLKALGSNSYLTRHSAFGCVPGYDCAVPAALDFAALVPPSRGQTEFRNRLIRPCLTARHCSAVQEPSGIRWSSSPLPRVHPIQGRLLNGKTATSPRWRSPLLDECDSSKRRNLNKHYRNTLRGYLRSIPNSCLFLHHLSGLVGRSANSVCS